MTPRSTCSLAKSFLDYRWTVALWNVRTGNTQFRGSECRAKRLPQENWHSRLSTIVPSASLGSCVVNLSNFFLNCGWLRIILDKFVMFGHVLLVICNSIHALRWICDELKCWITCYSVKYFLHFLLIFHGYFHTRGIVQYSRLVNIRKFLMYAINMLIFVRLDAGFHVNLNYL